MFDYKALLSNKYVQYIAIFSAGISVGVLFYPSKHIAQSLSTKYEQQISDIKQQDSKTLSDTQTQLNTEIEKESQLTEQYNSKITTLTSQISDMQSKQSSNYDKITHPDGTTEIKVTKETDVDQTNQVVSQMQSDFDAKIVKIQQDDQQQQLQTVQKLQSEFDSKEQTYKDTISSLQASKVEDTNKKNFGVEVGGLVNKNAYVHTTADIFGPVFLGVHTEVGPSSTLGAGFGLRF
jgi:chromosome segregation ATPase